MVALLTVLERLSQASWTSASTEAGRNHASRHDKSFQPSSFTVSKEAIGSFIFRKDNTLFLNKLDSHA